MSSNNQSWEKVGKTKTSAKGQKKVSVDKMPKSDVEVEPLKVAKSMFDAFADKSGGSGGNKKLPLQDRSNAQSSPKGKNKQKKSKKPSSTSRFKYNNFAEAIHDVSVVAVYEKANQLRAPHTIWQKAVAHDINETISCADESPALLEKDLDYPLSKVSKPIYAMLYKLFVDETSDVVRQLLFEHCVGSMIDCMIRDQPTWGYRLCIQVLAHGAPKVCIPPKYQREVEKMTAMVNTPKRCLAYMWALGQVGTNDPQCGMKVWLNMMLPMIKVKNVAAYVVHYLEHLLFSSKDPVARLSGSIDAEKFMEIMKWTFDPTTGLASIHRERLQEQHRPIRLIATGNAKTKVALFETFLKTPPEEIAQFRPQLLDIIFECMQGTPNCFKKWRELYQTSLPQTRMLLEYLEENWVQAVYKLPPKHFMETIRAFCITNSDEAAKSSPMTSVSDFKPVNRLCMHMNQKLERKSSRTLSTCTHIVLPILIALTAIAVGFFMYDVRTQGGVYKSVTYRTLDDTGTLKFLNQIWAKISTVLQHVTKWLQDNVPYYWNRTADILGPYFSYIAALLKNFITWLLEVTAPLRTLIGEYTKAGLVLCESFLQKLTIALNKLSVELRPSLLALQTWIDAKALAIYSFIRGEMGWCCVRDAVVENAKLLYVRLVDVWLFLWSYVLYVFKVVSDYVSGENM
uniref:transmembrane protein 214-A-like n=1 Tax=Styela clava TaxID=7725 RepID=UPI00193AA246|nr:transmembrane protein 214-A-like [Styela clava]